MPKKSNGHPIPPAKRNPTGKGGFRDHPENRTTNGQWDPKQSYDYQLRKLRQMTVAELKEFMAKPEDEMTVAQLEALRVHMAAMRDPDQSRKGLDALDTIMKRLEGLPTQKVDQTITTPEQTSIKVEFTGKEPDDDKQEAATESKGRHRAKPHENKDAA